MVVRTKSVYDPPSGEDGLRVLVTRYWPRGVKKGLVDEWVRAVSTPAELIREYKAGGLEWERFSELYAGYLKGPEGSEGFSALKALVKASGRKGVTLLCSCKEADKCHRTILKGLLE